MSEEIKETPSGELAQGDFKIKKKMKKLTTNKEVVKVNMAKKEEPKVEAIPNSRQQNGQQMPGVYG